MSFLLKVPTNKILGGKGGKISLARRLDNKSVWDLANCKKRCFICTKLLTGNPSILMKATTKYSNQSFATCLRELANSQFNFEVDIDDRVSF